MAVHIITSNGQTLLSEFKKAIEEKKIVTWAHENGYFTHDVVQWRRLAWFLPVVKNDRLVFNIIKPKNGKISSEVYAIYHGRLIETMLAHFDKNFERGVATAMPESPDQVQ